MVIALRAGVKHQAENSLSRLLTAGVDNTELENRTLSIAVFQTKSKENIKKPIVTSCAQKKKLSLRIQKSTTRSYPHYLSILLFGIRISFVNIHTN